MHFPLCHSSNTSLLEKQESPSYLFRENIERSFGNAENNQSLKKKVIEYCSHFLDLPMQILTVCVTGMSEYMYSAT